MTVFLVRHADAKSRANWPHADESRPLTKKGVAQAEGLVDLLHQHPIKRVVSSPFVRCVETVTPLASKVGRDVEEHELLEEGSDPASTYELMRKLAHGPGDAVLCTHGDLVPELLRLATRDGLTMEDAPRWAKGSTWILEGDGKRFNGVGICRHRRHEQWRRIADEDDGVRESIPQRPPQRVAEHHDRVDRDIRGHQHEQPGPL